MDSKKHARSCQRKDPVCGMTVEAVAGTLACTHEGQRVYFCSPECLRAFEKNPAKYAGPGKPKGWWGRYMERMEKANQKVFGPSKPQCH